MQDIEQYFPETLILLLRKSVHLSLDGGSSLHVRVYSHEVWLALSIQVLF